MNNKEDTTAILKLIYPKLQTSLSNSSNVNAYKRFISKFITNRHEALYANAPYTQIYFGIDDETELFKALKINKPEITSALKQTYYSSISSFNPSYAKDECTIVLLCVVRYFKIKKMSKELDLSLIIMGFSGKFYPSIWYRSFPTVAPNPNVMDYVITHNTTNKYDIVREGNIINAVKSRANTWVTSYEDRFKSFTDYDCVYLVQQLHNRIGSFMTNIAELYYKAYKDKEFLNYSSDDLSEDNYHLADSDSLKIERAVSTTMAYINNHGINQRICKMASNDLVKMVELKSIIENILADNKNMPLVKELLSLMILNYFKETGKLDVKDVQFITYSLKPKPNTTDKYKVRQKELLDILLTNNAEHFNRRRSRAATEQAYYRGINAYFALTIQEAN